MYELSKTAKTSETPSTCKHNCYEDLNHNIAPQNFTNLVKEKIQKLFSHSEEKNLQPKTCNELREAFYDRMTHTLAKQKATEEIITIIKSVFKIDKFEDISLDVFSKMVDFTINNIDLNNLAKEHLREQTRDFSEIKKMISILFSNENMKESLIKGNKNILDLAAGRGEFGISLLFELHLERLEQAKLLNASQDTIKYRFNELGFSPNKLTFIEPFDYHKDTIEVFKDSPHQLKDAIFIFNSIETKNSTLQGITFPDESIIISHRACGTLGDDIIKKFNESQAKTLILMPCCLYKACGETPRYNLTQEAWDSLCNATDDLFIKRLYDEFTITRQELLELSDKAKKFDSAYSKINTLRTNALKSLSDVFLEPISERIILANKR